jgi:hypothetical protein
MTTPLWEELGIDKTLFDKLSPSERIRLQREHHPQPPVQRRPIQDYKPTAEEQAELDAITNRHDRTTRSRQLRDQAAS